MTKASKRYDYTSVFPQRFRALMDERKISQGVIAEICAVKRQSVSQWLNGETRPDILSLTNIAQYFNVSTDYLLGLTDVKSTDKATKQLCATLGLSESTITLLSKSKSSRLYNCIKAKQLEYEAERNFSNFEDLKEVREGLTRDTYIESAADEVIKLLSIGVADCFNRMAAEYIEEYTNNTGRSLLSELIAFYSMMQPETIELFEIDKPTPNGYTNDSNLCFLWGDYCRDVKLSELLINSQIIEITSKLNQMMHQCLKESEAKQ